jgi:glycerol-3-phosphate cytidylyltransferase
MELKKYKVGFTAGSFDCLHFGHVLLLQRAKAYCEKLCVAVSTDELIKEHKLIMPVMPLHSRIALVNELKCVDFTVIQNKLIDIEQFQMLNCDVFFIGDDWINRHDVPGLEWLRENNKVIFLPYTKEVSSSLIKEKIINNADAILDAQKARKLNE